MPRILTAVLAAALVAAGLAPAAAADAEPVVTTQVVDSFDGTAIVSTLFLPAEASAADPVPVVLRTHGWGGQGETEAPPGSTLRKLVDDGYAVLTWDQRGFGFSGGTVEVAKPEFEGRDTSALIDFLAEQPEILLDGPGDPRVGFSGGSYAGGIQFSTAAFDPRVDVLAPEIAWFDLRYSLYENDVLSFGWAELLYAAGKATATTLGLDPRNPAGPQVGGYSPELDRIQAVGLATNEVDEAGLDYFAASSLATYGDANPVARPTLVMQGSVDTLFDLTDGAGLYRHVRDTGAPAKFVVFCGGHVTCPASYAGLDDRAYLDERILDWFDVHLRGADRDTGPAVEYRTNEGEWRTAGDWPPPDARPIVVGGGAATLAQTPVPQLNDPDVIPIATPSDPRDPQASEFFELAAADDGPLELVGVPRLRLEVAGTGPVAHVFAKLVDREAGEVVNLQETPVRVDALSDEAQVVEVDMSGVAYTLPKGHHLDLQLATTSLMHATARTPAQVDAVAEVAVPVRVPARVDRLAGADRIVTAAAVSADAFDEADAVVLATAGDYPDALAGGPLAAAVDGPLLLTGSDRLAEATAAEIDRLGATRAVLLGGERALSAAVADDLSDAGVGVERLAGAERFDTARLVAERVGDGDAFLVQGAADSPERGWPDAVAVSALAAERGQPIVLTETGTLPAASAAALQGRDRVTIVGGPAAVSQAVADTVGADAEVDRLSGATRYETSRAVAEAALADDTGSQAPSQAWLATGLDFPDALAAGPAAAASDALLLLVDGRSLEASAPTATLLAELGPTLTRVVLVGGEQALSPTVARQAGRTIAR